MALKLSPIAANERAVIEAAKAGQRNIWGTPGGLEPQRTDLWRIKMGQAILSISERISKSGNWEMANAVAGLRDRHHFYATAISFPALTVAAERTYVDSRPFMLPAYDQALEQFSISFVHDIGVNQYENANQSDIYVLLEAWRAIVRAGRGAMTSTTGFYGLGDVELDSNYRITYAFDIAVELLKGAGQISYQGDNAVLLTTEANKMEVSSRFVFKKAWLSSIKLPDLSYRESQVGVITANFYAADLVSG